MFIRDRPPISFDFGPTRGDDEDVLHLFTAAAARKLIVVDVELHRKTFVPRVALFSGGSSGQSITLGRQLPARKDLPILLDAKSGNQIDQASYEFHKATSSCGDSSIRINRLGSLKSNSITRGAKRRA